ncbi:hypothetical protein C1646_764693 [Rhizophagus diaphanus]|nr:hypothetical protein C1646_764693 [Rhizophagus diaphanus] [Rhizophagus sp. MUCL 43196]
MVEACEHEISFGANVKCQNNDQTILEDFYENSDLSKERKEDIDTALIKAFDDTMLTQEILRVNVKLYRLLEEESNLTLGKQDILWKIRDFSGESHTAEFLARQIQLIIEEIGIQKFAGIVTDAGSNSHRPKELLELKILEKQIDGRGLKTYLDTRWTTVYEMLNSISRLELYLKEVVINENSTIITSEAVKTIINWKRGFFNDVYDLSNVMKPIRDAILSLENPCQYQRIQSAAARIWQQMLKISNIAAYLKKFNQTKKQSAEILLAQIGEFYLQSVPYNTPYNSQVNTPLSWWNMCTPIPPYLQLLAIKLFSIIPHAAKAIAKIHSYYIANSRSELPNYSKDRTADELCAILNDANLCDDDEYVDDYNEEEMIKDNLTDKQLELDGIDDFIQELDKEDDFDPDLLYSIHI